MQFQSKNHISPLLPLKSPVAQLLEHPTRSRRGVRIPSGARIFFRVKFLLDAKTSGSCISTKRMTLVKLKSSDASLSFQSRNREIGRPVSFLSLQCINVCIKMQTFIHWGDRTTYFANIFETWLLD